MLAVKLLARHVARRAEHLLLDGDGFISSRSGKPEVSKEGRTGIVEKNIARFHVAVENALAMRSIEGTCYLGEYTHGQRLIEPSADSLLECTPFYESH